MTMLISFRSTGVKALLITLIAFPAGVLAQSATDDVITISQKRRKYAPGAVTLKPGETLRIVNDDIFLHHAFVDEEALQYDSGSMEEGETRDIEFTEAGNYQVRCAIHPRMRLAVTVQ
ncbi:MAG: cupredoxin domain-containing protein [Litorimonas sp.]